MEKFPIIKKKYFKNFLYFTCKNKINEDMDIPELTADKKRPNKINSKK